jgi:hypothetical protein
MPDKIIACSNEITGNSAEELDRGPPVWDVSIEEEG